MLISASMINQPPIITIKEDKMEKNLTNNIYDGQTNLVKALLVDEKGWFIGAKMLLITDITSLGDDAVTNDDGCFTTN